MTLNRYSRLHVSFFLAALLTGVFSVSHGQDSLVQTGLDPSGLHERPGGLRLEQSIPGYSHHPHDDMKHGYPEHKMSKEGQPLHWYTDRHVMDRHVNDRHAAYAQRDKIIHVTDYLYRMPEIREAYETYLRLRDEAPEELFVMQQIAEYDVGDTRLFFVYNLDESEPGSAVYDEILFELRAAGEKSEIWVEQAELAPGKIDEPVVEAIMEALEERTPPRSVNPDQGIILNNIDIFAMGDPSRVPNPDGTGVVKILITNVQDGWDPDEGGGFTAGFFNPADLAPRTVNRNSNEAAILYINSYPGIYTDDEPANPSRPLNTVAHEFQHLIQAGRGNLITFMDEGQSEIAEILNGFNARSMVFLDSPDEVSGNVESQSADGFLRWRRGEKEVLEDYQRAQLFHSYLYERVGVDAVGSLTQSGSGNPWVQYQNMLNNAGSGLGFRRVLSDFYVANWLNDPTLSDGRFGYTLPQQTVVRVTNPGQRYDAEARPWVRNEPVSLQYGGAKYIHWRHVQDLSLSISSPSEIYHYVIAVSEGGDGDPEVIEMDGSDLFLEGMYSSIVLVSVNTLIQSISNFGSRLFTYTADWIPSDLRVVDISYAVKPTAGFVPFPFEYNPDTKFRGISVRVDPEYEGVLQGVDFQLWHTEEAVRGNGTLLVSLTESHLRSGQGADAVFAPQSEIAYLTIDFADLNPGMNSVDFSEFDITMAAERNYHFVFVLYDESEDGRLLFTFDQGSNEKSDQNYYPVRTLLAGFNRDGDLTGWSRLIGNDENVNDNDNKNLLMTTRILSRVPLNDGIPELPETDRFELLSNYPNPFNSQTVIRFNVPASVEGDSRVLIELYDILGRRVQTLMDDSRQAGAHQVLFAPGNLASGIYVVRMLAGGTSDAHKIMYLK